MSTTTRISTAERLGRFLGRGWRAYARGERRVSGRLVASGLPAGVAVALLWAVKLLVLGVLLYVAFWFALLVAFAVAVAWAAERSSDDEDEDFMNRKAEERDHRESLTYDPINYNDDPDPRFDDT